MELFCINYFEYIARRMVFFQKTIKRDVDEFLESLLLPLLEDIDKLPRDESTRILRATLQGDAEYLYWSLKAHLYWHLKKCVWPRDTGAHLAEVGKWSGLEDYEMKPEVNLNRLIDPATKLLEMFSRIEGSRNKRGSKEHAKSVFEMAKFWLGRLKAENIFLPDVMAIVKHAHSGRSFVGASIAVSDFLRPICLFNRILNLKDGLGASVISSESLNIPDQSNWQFSYAYKAERYDSLNDGLPCQNCRMIFQEDRSGRGGPTFLGACAEYCAVDELLPNEQTLRYTMDERVKSKLERNLKQCTDLFKEYRDKSKKCITAFESGNLNEIETLYWEVIYLFHTFGLRPECNRHF